MAERRRSVRQKSFLKGRVYFNKGRESADCLVRDLTNQGARIIFSDSINIPALIDLHIPQKDYNVRARVIWRQGVEIGLAFPDANLVPSAPTQSNDLAERVSKIETEIALMRRTLRGLMERIRSDSDAV
jgi:hypothetical protein